MTAEELLAAESSTIAGRDAWLMASHTGEIAARDYVWIAYVYVTEDDQAGRIHHYRWAQWVAGDRREGPGRWGGVIRMSWEHEEAPA